MINKQILVVDDEIGIRELLSEILTDEGYEVTTASDACQAREIYARYQPQLILLDIWMPGEDGLVLLKEWREPGQVDIPVVMMSGHATVDMAVEATKVGAFGFLEKPIALPKLLGMVAQAMEYSKKLAEKRFSILELGHSAIINAIRDQLEAFLKKPATTPLVLVGEQGCGLALAAHHVISSEALLFAPQDDHWLEDNPFLPLDKYQHGAVFIESLESLPLLAQKGLRHLMEKMPRYDMRLICGTSLSLSELTAAGHMVSGELERLRAEVILIPAVREHTEDIPDIAHHFLHRMAKSEEIPQRSVTVGALSLLSQYGWPGNLPELANVLRHLALTCATGEITYEDVHQYFAGNVLSEQNRVSYEPHDSGIDQELAILYEQPLRQARNGFERRYLEYHLRVAKGNMSRVAEHVGLERTHLYRKLRQLGIETAYFRGEPDKSDVTLSDSHDG